MIRMGKLISQDSNRSSSRDLRKVVQALLTITMCNITNVKLTAERKDAPRRIR